MWGQRNIQTLSSKCIIEAALHGYSVRCIPFWDSSQRTQVKLDLTECGRHCRIELAHRTRSLMCLHDSVTYLVNYLLTFQLYSTFNGH